MPALVQNKKKKGIPLIFIVTFHCFSWIKGEFLRDQNVIIIVSQDIDIYTMRCISLSIYILRVYFNPYFRD